MTSKDNNDTTPIDPPSIEMSPEEFRKLGYQAIDMIADAMKSWPQEQARRAVPDNVRNDLFTQPLPHTGTVDSSALLQRVEQHVFPYPLGHNHPRFFAWVNPPAAPMGVLGDLLAAGMNSSVAGGDHAATYVEHAVLRWLKMIMGFAKDDNDDESGAILVSGGSMASIVGLAVMRHVQTKGLSRSAGLYPQAGAPLLVYTSTEGHSCIQKAVELLGFGNENLRKIPVDEEYGMDVEALSAQIAVDREAGYRPVCVVASAGTVNTGAIDNFNAIADLCEQQELWMHVDGAFGGVAILAPEVSDLYSGIERADSLGIDPHKWMYMPTDCGCAIVRDKKAMRETFSLLPAYLRDDRNLPWFAEFGPQQTRSFRALKLWLTMQQIGVDGYSRYISRDIQLARTLQEKLRAHVDFRVVAAGPLSVTCFVYEPEGYSGDVAELNRSLLELVQKEGTVYLTSTLLQDKFVLRANIINFRTTKEDLDILIACLERAGELVVHL